MIIALASLACVVAAAPARPIPAQVEHTFAIGADAVLVVRLPETWVELRDADGEASTPGPRPFTVRWRPPQGDEWTATLSAMPAPEGFDPATVVDGVIEDLRPSAREPKLLRRPLKSASITGAYVWATDKTVDPRAHVPDQFPYVLSAVARVGPLAVLVTILSRTDTQAFRDGMLEVVGGLRVAEAAGPPPEPQR